MAWNKYPYTDNHELNLDWFLDQFKQLLAAWSDLQAAWTAYKTDLTGQWEAVEAAWQRYKTYIDDYFANLNVQEEINNKINDMAISGELLSVISPTVVLQTTNTTNQWLAEHISQETGYVIDKSLSIDNAAANSKTVGDMLLKNNSVNLLEMHGTLADHTHNGVTFSFDGNVCTVNGTPSDIAYCNIISSQTTWPEWLEKGVTYNFHVITTNRTQAQLCVIIYVGTTPTYIYAGDDRDIAMPDNATGIIVRVTTSSSATGTTINNAKVTFSLNSEKTNSELDQDIKTNGYNISVNRKQIATGVINIAEYFDKDVNGSLAGITYSGTLPDDITVTGSASAASYYNLLDSHENMPDWLMVNNTYVVRFNTTDSNVGFVILAFSGENYKYILNTLDFTPRREQFVVKLPSDATGIIFRLVVRVGSTVNGTCKLSINPYNVIDVFETDMQMTDRIHNGITYTWNQTTRTCHAIGTATGQSQSYLWYSAALLPANIIPGNSYWFGYDTTDNNFRIQLYTANANGLSRIFDVGFGKVLQIPNDTVGFGIRLSVPDGSTVDAYISNIVVLSEYKYQMPKKLITIVDDDTTNTVSVQRYHDACKHNGIVGNYAVMSYHIDHNDTDLNTLLSYEAEGFGMLTHCYYQSGTENWNEGTTRNIEYCYNDIAKAVRLMKNYGFITYPYWATPAGLRDRDIELICRHYGFRCMVTGFNGDWNHAENGSRYLIKRIGYESTDTNPNFSQATVKEIIDKFMSYDGDGWLIITTHFSTWPDSNEWNSSLDSNGYPIGYSRFNELIQYAKNAGCKFVSFPEGFSFYELYCID